MREVLEEMIGRALRLVDELDAGRRLGWNRLFPAKLDEFARGTAHGHAAWLKPHGEDFIGANQQLAAILEEEAEGGGRAVEARAALRRHLVGVLVPRLEESRTRLVRRPGWGVSEEEFARTLRS
jgi:hypothetical protein